MKQHVVMTAKEIDSAIKKMAGDIIEDIADLENVVFIGIVTRGVCIANRLIQEIKKKEQRDFLIGNLDITFYRDDIDSIARQPIAKETKIPLDLTDKKIILVDDVLFTGRSTRAALDEIMDFARPKSIQFAVLIDRGHRELPIQADFVGKVIKTNYTDEIQVRLKEIDKIDKVTLVTKSKA